MSVEVDGAAASPVVRLLGELDLAGVELVRSRVDAVLAGEPPGLVFDLEDLSFIDSSGLGVLIDAARRTAVTVRRPTSAVRRVFEVTGLDEVWDTES